MGTWLWNRSYEFLHKSVQMREERSFSALYFQGGQKSDLSLKQRNYFCFKLKVQISSRCLFWIGLLNFIKESVWLLFKKWLKIRNSCDFSQLFEVFSDKSKGRVKFKLLPAPNWKLRVFKWIFGLFTIWWFLALYLYRTCSFWVTTCLGSELSLLT